MDTKQAVIKIEHCQKCDIKDCSGHILPNYLNGIKFIVCPRLKQRINNLEKWDKGREINTIQNKLI